MIKVVKTVGVARDAGGKDYRLHLSNGETVLAVKDGQRYRVGDTVDTLKNLKAHVVAGLRGDTLSQIETTDQTREDAPRPGFGALWSCACPAALLALRIDERGPTRDEERTLDTYGYITPSGSVDVESARAAVSGYITSIS